MRPRRASPNGTSERSSTRPPQYRASGSRTTSRGSPTAFDTGDVVNERSVCARLKSTFDFRKITRRLLLLRLAQRAGEFVERFELHIRQIHEGYLLVQDLQGVLRVACD